MCACWDTRVPVCVQGLPCTFTGSEGGAHAGIRVCVCVQGGHRGSVWGVQQWAPVCGATVCACAQAAEGLLPPLPWPHGPCHPRSRPGATDSSRAATRGGCGWQSSGAATVGVPCRCGVTSSSTRGGRPGCARAGGAGGSLFAHPGGILEGGQRGQHPWNPRDPTHPSQCLCLWVGGGLGAGLAGANGGAAGRGCAVPRDPLCLGRPAEWGGTRGSPSPTGLGWEGAGTGLQPWPWQAALAGPAAAARRRSMEYVCGCR